MDIYGGLGMMVYEIVLIIHITWFHMAYTSFTYGMKNWPFSMLNGVRNRKMRVDLNFAPSTPKRLTKAQKMLHLTELPSGYD